MSNVSIIIPCYQQERFIAETIDSALNQTHKHVEVIVVNDGSTDGSHNIISSYGDRIRYISKANEGVSKTRNRGAEVASGKYLIFLDGDDILHPQAVENHLRGIELQPKGFSILAHVPFSGQPPAATPTSDTSFSSKKAWPAVLHGNPAVPSRIMMSKRDFDRAGGFRLKSWGCEDWALTICLTLYAEEPSEYMLHECNSTGVFYRLTDCNISRQNSTLISSMTDVYELAHDIIVSELKLPLSWREELAIVQRHVLRILIAQKQPTSEQRRIAANLSYLKQELQARDSRLTRRLDQYLGPYLATKLTLLKWRLFNPQLFASYARVPFFKNPHSENQADLPLRQN